MVLAKCQYIVSSSSSSLIAHLVHPNCHAKREGRWILSFLQMTEKPPNSLNKKAKKPSTLSYVLLVLLGISVCSFVQMKGLLQAYDSSGDGQGSHHQTALESSLSAFKSGKKEAALPAEDAMLSPAVVEDPIPNPELTNGYETVSACLLVMDDNHRLIECKWKEEEEEAPRVVMQNSHHSLSHTQKSKNPCCASHISHFHQINNRDGISLSRLATEVLGHCRGSTK